MKLSYVNKIFVFSCSFDERDTPKEAGFRWSAQRWWTAHTDVARRLEEYADQSAKDALADVKVVPPLLMPSCKVQGAFVAEIYAKSGTVGWEHRPAKWIEVHYPEKDEELRELVKGIGFSWSEKLCWQRILTERSGDLHERTAETAHMLLEEGFRVRIHSPKASEIALSGNYEPEQTRWIDLHTVKPGSESRITVGDYFSFSWARRDDLYDRVKTLPGAKYNGSTVLVPVGAYDAVVGFAERFKFALDPAAEAEIERQRMSAMEKVIVVRKPRKSSADPVIGKRPARLAAIGGVQIDASLLDD